MITPNRYTPPLVGILLALACSPVWSIDSYWIESRGTWSDLSQESARSAGTPDLGELPTRKDRKIFDTQSFAKTKETVHLSGQMLPSDLRMEGPTKRPAFERPASAGLQAHDDISISTSVDWQHPGHLVWANQERELVVDLNAPWVGDLNILSHIVGKVLLPQHSGSGDRYLPNTFWPNGGRVTDHSSAKRRQPQSSGGFEPGARPPPSKSKKDTGLCTSSDDPMK